MKLYLIRHGQAGTRDAYDSLSELGHKQCRMLGEYLASQNITFAAAYSGEMVRQQRTAAETSAAYGPAFPLITTDAGWNEFGLDRLYRELAPQLCADDDTFRIDFEAMREQVQASGGQQHARVHRRWLPCDTTLVNTWISGRYSQTGETWQQFRDRVAACRQRLGTAQRHDNIAVFTSAAPIGIWTTLALGLDDSHVMKLAGVLHNSSFTILQLREGDLRLFAFNTTPHLPQPDLRTFR